MSEDIGLKATFGADSSGLEDALNNLKEALSGFGSEAEKAGDKASKGGKKAQDAFADLKSQIMDLIPAISAAFVVDKIVAFGKDSIAAFADAEKAAAQLDYAITKIGGGSEDTYRKLIDWTEQLALSLNDLYTPKQLEQAEKQLSVLGLNADQIQKLLPLVIDFAQATGKDLPEATSIAVAAINGQSRGLKDIGGRFKDTGDQTQNFNILLEKLGKVAGAAKSQLDLLANQEQESANRMEEFQEEVGKSVSGLEKWWMSVKNGYSITGYLQQELADGKITTEEYTTAIEKLGGGYEDNVKAVSDYLAKTKELHAETQKLDDDLTSQFALQATGTSSGMNTPFADTSENNRLGKTPGGEAQDPTEKIKSLLEITDEAQAHMATFGDSRLTTLKTEIEDINKSMQSLFEKGQANTKEFTDMAQALAQTKALQTITKSQEAAQKKTFGTPLTPIVPDTESAEPTGDQSKLSDSMTKQVAALLRIQDMANEAKAAIALFGATDLSRLNGSLLDVENQMIKMKAAGMDSGAAWNNLVEQQKLLKTAIDDSNASMENQSKSVAKLQASANTFASISTSVGNSMGKLMSDTIAGKQTSPVDMFKDMLSDLAKALGDFIKKKGEMIMQAGIADIVAGNLLIASSLGLDPMGYQQVSDGTGKEVAGAGLIAAGSLIGAIKMASGGIVSGNALVNVGEYPGAAHNPEVIAPLDKLKQHLGGGGGGNDTFTVEGNKLVSVMDKVNTNTMFNIGGGGS